MVPTCYNHFQIKSDQLKGISNKLITVLFFLLQLIAYSLPLTHNSFLFASFEELPTGARPAGMGNAFTTVADDVYSMYYNPAGLIQVQRPEFSGYYAKLHAGLSDNSNISRSYVAYGHPMGSRGTIGASFLSLNLSGLYTEQTIGMTYANQFAERLNLGATLKMLRKSFGSDAYTQNAINSDTGASSGSPDPLFATYGNSKSAASLDLGAQYRISKSYAVGVAFLNVNNPNTALSDSDTDPVAPVYKFGMARRTKMSSAAAELSLREFTSYEARLNMGLERWFESGFAIRGGLGFGQRQYQITTVGFGYRWQNFQADYAMIYPLLGVKGTFGTHQLSLTFRIGRKEP